MKSRFLITSLGILAASAVGVSSAFFLNRQPAPAQIPQSDISKSQSDSHQRESKSNTESAPPVIYTVKDYEGQLAIFIDDSTVPDLTFEVYTKHLPEYDQKLLAEGIKVEGYDELMKLIEDYIS